MTDDLHNVLQYESATHPPRRELPTAAKVVAWLFVGFGVLAAIEVVVGLFNDRCSFNLNVLGIPLGIGLLKRSETSRSISVVMLWIAVVLSAVMGIFLLFMTFSGSGTMSFRGRQIRQGDADYRLLLGMGLFVALVAIAALEVWMLRILRRADTRAACAPWRPRQRPAYFR